MTLGFEMAKFWNEDHHCARFSGGKMVFTTAFPLVTTLSMRLELFSEIALDPSETTADSSMVDMTFSDGGFAG